MGNIKKEKKKVYIFRERILMKVRVCTQNQCDCGNGKKKLNKRIKIHFL